AAFELWLLRKMTSLGSEAVAIAEPPYHFDAGEAALVGRYRYYFTYPAEARGSASVLASVGLTALVLTLWLTFRHALAPAVLIGANLFVVANFTKRLSPVMVLRMAAAKGKRDALQMLEAHETAWAKIKAANASA